MEFTPRPLLQSQSLTCLRSCEQVDALSGSLDGSGCSYDHQGGLEKHFEGLCPPHAAHTAPGLVMPKSRPATPGHMVPMVRSQSTDRFLWAGVETSAWALRTSHFLLFDGEEKLFDSSEETTEGLLDHFL